ncbi:MAG: tetratricopeptide repeat protein [Streptosporangiaceae bacterium]|nr:tetratricopeptide repeat protein [Streptosporangiaceae bacterium]MBV9853929.1 tetratricopeptide repeat protein [Streptosporangiaceae bacterium]
MTETSATQSRNGRIVTFYSYKGGTGRTMALANVAWILAANGHRVLVADWDLESPGLYRFLYPFLDPGVRDAPGIIELVRGYESAAATSDEEGRLEKDIAERSQVHGQAHALNWKFPDSGRLDFLSAGKQNQNYSTTLSGLDWDNFYTNLNGGEFLDAVREDMKRHYDYVLIDSRTGFSDVADICTVHLPDILVDCFTLSTQGIEGAARRARDIEEGYEFRSIRVLPVPMRVDLGEQERVEASRAYASRTFEGLPAGMSDAQRRAYWANVEVPYRPFYAFEETLAVFGDTPGVPGSMLSSYERITSYITDGVVTGLPAIDEDLRNNTRLKFIRRPPLESNEITIEFLPEDQLWAEWIAAVLRDGGFAVRERPLDAPGGRNRRDPVPSRTVTVVSAAYVARRYGRPSGEPDDAKDARKDGKRESAPAARSGFAVYVTATRPLAEFPPASSVSMVGVREEDAIDRLQSLLRLPAGSEVKRTRTTSYPGREPKILRVGARNDSFTGREKDLRELRENLRNSGTSIVRPVTLHGTGGVGKTQVALEYVHRFKNDYDVVWWVQCGQPESIDIRVADLAPLLRERFGVTVPAEATVEEQARLVLDVLSRGSRVPRWLLVYDNAEDIGAIQRYLPSSGGHVLITSQNAGWADQGARSLPVDLFKREESVSHLLRVVPSLTRDEANDVAEALGDLPLAVAAAAAFLKGSVYPVSEYLSRLQSEARSALAITPLADYPQGVSAAWDPSLKLLQDRSPAAARLLQLCSVMAPEIALDLIYSPAMARTLEPYDPALAEPMIMGRVVQEISRLALLKLDPNANQIQIHRLVQEVVQSRMPQAQLAEARGDVQRILVAARPRREVDEPATWSRYRLLWPHLAPSGVVSSGSEQVRQLIVDRVRYIWVFNDFDRGVAEAVAAQERWEEMLAEGPDGAAARALRTQLLQLRFNLGNILRSQSRYEDARELDERVLAEQTEILGAEHPHTLMTAGGLAADLRALGRYREALQMDRKTYPAWTELYGEDHRRTLSAANNLAISLRLTGHVSEALHLDNDTFDRFRATLGAQNPLTLDTARNIVRDLLEVGRYTDAVNRMEDVWQASVATLGINSPAALGGRMLLGIALRSAGRLTEAEEAFDEALTGLAARFGDSSSDALACRLSRSANLLSLDLLDEGEADIRAVLAEYERRLGPGHPHTLVCRVNLSSALRLRAMRDEAMTAISAAMGGLEVSLGAEHPYTLAAAMVLAVLLADQGDLDQAADLEARTAASLERTLGPAHPDTLRCRANLLLTRQQQGNRAAQAEREAVMAELEVVIGEDHPSIEALRGERRLMRALDPQPF